MLIIGLTGNAGSGKSTAAALLRQYYRLERFAFADRLKEVCWEAFEPMGIPREAFYGSKAEKEQPREELNGKSGRDILVEVGQYGRSVVDDLWIRSLDPVVRTAKVGVVIEDVRYPNECEYIRQLGGIIIRLVRHDALPFNDDEMAMLHEPAEYCVINDTDNRADLYAQLSDIVEGLP